MQFRLNLEKRCFKICLSSVQGKEERKKLIHTRTYQHVEASILELLVHLAQGAELTAEMNTAVTTRILRQVELCTEATPRCGVRPLTANSR